MPKRREGVVVFGYRAKLTLVGLSTVLLIIVIVFLPSSILRPILGLPFLLFSPGYTLMLLLFPGKATLDRIERVALSFGLSITVIPLIALILTYTSWGLNLFNILVSVAAFIILTLPVGWYRNWKLHEIEEPVTRFNPCISFWRQQGPAGKALSILLVAVVLCSAGTLWYAVITPVKEETFTEFYLLGQEGDISDYPEQVTAGDKVSVITVIINHEQKLVTYRIEITVDGLEVGKAGPFSLGQGEKWEQETSFSLTKSGNKQKVNFLLYKEEVLYTELNLFIDVIEKADSSP
jgi:uncharacterized membrane protein